MKNTKLRIIVPANTDKFNKYILESPRSVIPESVDLDIKNITGGNDYIACRYNIMQNEPHLVKAAKESQDEGVQGIFVSDMDFCGVEVAREVLDIPIIGGFRPSAFTAMSLGQKFSIITITESIMDYQIEHIRAFGITQNFASIRPTQIPVPVLSGMYTNPTYKGEVIEKVTSESKKAIEEDGADAIIFGCTGFIDIASEVHRNLKTDGYDVPVLDPNKVGINFLYTLVNNKLMQSRLTYYKYK
ncbi:MAG: aspartate/glutamate racemase family protein [Fusobacteriota bacterium]